MSLRYMWFVVKKNGRANHWVSYKKKGPKPDEHGFLQLGKGKYIINPSKLTRWTFRGKEYAFMAWKEDSADPIDLFGENDPKFTSYTISKMSKARRLEKLIQPPSWDIVKIALVLSLLLNGLVVLSIYF